MASRPPRHTTCQVWLGGFTWLPRLASHCAGSSLLWCGNLDVAADSEGVAAERADRSALMVYALFAVEVLADADVAMAAFAGLA